jgi:predicted dehydrogenase
MALRVGFVGIGGIMGVHMRSLSAMKDVKMVAFCDKKKSLANAAARQYGGKAYSDPAEMYKQERLDAAYIAVPPNAHGEPETEALKRGVHLFIEPPLAIDRDTALKVADAVNSSQCIVSVGYHLRYCDVVQRARRVPGTRKPSLILGWWLEGVPNTEWWPRKQVSGGQLLERTTHVFDLARYLGGEVSQVYSSSTAGLMEERRDFTVEDSSTVTLQFENGAIGNISSTCVHSGFSRIGLLCVYRDLCFECTGDKLRVTDTQCVHEYARSVDPYQVEDEVFMTAVANGSPVGIRSPYEEALKTHLLATGANEALKESTSQAV